MPQFPTAQRSAKTLPSCSLKTITVGKSNWEGREKKNKKKNHTKSRAPCQPLTLTPFWLRSLVFPLRIFIPPRPNAPRCFSEEFNDPPLSRSRGTARPFPAPRRPVSPLPKSRRAAPGGRAAPRPRIAPAPRPARPTHDRGCPHTRAAAGRPPRGTAPRRPPRAEGRAKGAQRSRRHRPPARCAASAGPRSKQPKRRGGRGQGYPRGCPAPPRRGSQVGDGQRGAGRLSGSL